LIAMVTTVTSLTSLAEQPIPDECCLVDYQNPVPLEAL